MTNFPGHGFRGQPTQGQPRKWSQFKWRPNQGRPNQGRPFTGHPNQGRPFTGHPQRRNRSLLSTMIYVSILILILTVLVYFGVQYYRNWLIESTVEREFIRGYTDPESGNRKFIDGRNNWKYTDKVDEIDCLNNWDYYKADGTTIIQKDIKNLTKLNKERNWCATYSDTAPIDRGVQLTTTAVGTVETIGMIAAGELAEYTLRQLLQRKIVLESQEQLLRRSIVEATSAGDQAVIRQLEQQIDDVLQGKLQLQAAESVSMLKQGPRQILSKIKTSISAKFAFRYQAKSLLKFSKSFMGRSAQSFASALRTVAVFARSSGKLAKVGVMASKAAVKFAKSLTSPAVIFDIISLVLDLANIGDYGTVETKEDLYKMKKEIDTQLKQVIFDEMKPATEEAVRKIDPNYNFTMSDFEFPIVFNPIDALQAPDDENGAKFAAKRQEWMDKKFDELIEYAKANPDSEFDPAINDYYTAITNDIIYGKLSLADMLDSDDSILMDKYGELINVDLLGDYVDKEMCESVDGVFTDKNICTLPKQKCISRNDSLGPDDLNTDFINGVCVVTVPSMRETCKEKNLPYDAETGICKIDATYCRVKKGVDYIYNSNIKKIISTDPAKESDKTNDLYKDCTVTPGQQTAEFIVGTTITRFFKGSITPLVDVVSNIISPPVVWEYGSNNIKLNGKCLDIVDGKHPKIILNDCNNSDNQKFEYKENEDGNAIIQYNGSFRDKGFHKYCLEIPSGRTENDTNLYISSCNALPNQLFTYDDDKKTLKYGDKCVNAQNSDNGAPVNIWNCNNGTYQKLDIPKVRQTRASPDPNDWSYLLSRSWV